MENIVWRKAETDMELKKAEERAEAGERTEGNELVLDRKDIAMIRLAIDF